MLFGRNNFGSNMFHMYAPKFQSKRQVKKLIRKICGRNYPLSASVVIGRLEDGGAQMLMLNRRGIKRMLDLMPNNAGYEDLKTDFWNTQRREENGLTLDQQAWGFMANHYKHDWKMKEPK